MMHAIVKKALFGPLPQNQQSPQAVGKKPASAATNRALMVDRMQRKMKEHREQPAFEC